jgi:hypothetical protein
VSITVRGPDIQPWAHWNRERLTKEKTDNPRAFARGFQMRAFTDSERMFPSFTKCYAHGVVTGEIMRRGWPVFVGVDLAGAKRPGNVIVVVALDPITHRRYPIEILAGAWTSPETATKLGEVHMRHPNVRVIMVENNGYQQALIDWIKSSKGDHSYWYKIEAFTTGENKHAPQTGLPSLEVEFANGAWVIPADEFEGHPPTCRCPWCVWKGEFRDYPMGATTDHVMGTWFAREAVARWGTLSMGAGAVGDINTR